MPRRTVCTLSVAHGRMSYPHFCGTSRYPCRERRLRQGESRLTSHRSHSVLALIAGIASLAVPSVANAGPLVADAPDCSAQSAAQVFAPWADPAFYVPAPGGDAESARGWAATAGASFVAGNEPWQIHGATDAHALQLAPGASATTATMCIGIEHPDVRFFVRGINGSVSVESIVETASGDVVSVPVGAAGSAAWAPTTVMPIAASLLPLLPGEHTPVQFRFTSTGQAPVAIDDVYVDPFGRY